MLLHLLLKIVYPLIACLLLPTSTDKRTAHSLHLLSTAVQENSKFISPPSSYLFFAPTVNSLNPTSFLPIASTQFIFSIPFWLCFPNYLFLLGWNPKCDGFPESNQHRARQERLPHLPIPQLSQFLVAPQPGHFAENLLPVCEAPCPHQSPSSRVPFQGLVMLFLFPPKRCFGIPFLTDLFTHVFSPAPQIYRNCRQSNSKDRQVWLTWAHHLPSSHLHQPLGQNCCFFLIHPLKTMAVCDSAAIINDGLLNFHWGQCSSPALTSDMVSLVIMPMLTNPSAPQVWLVLPQPINHCSLLLLWTLASLTKRLCRATLALWETWATFRFADKISLLCPLNNLACSYCL